MSVMAHANGARCVENAAVAGVDSSEHGAYLDKDALDAMEDNGTIWVPTLSTIANLRRTGRHPEGELEKILDYALQSVADYKGLIAPGTDAGAFAVPHGTATEESLLQSAGVSSDRIQAGILALMAKF
jgi:imidazolonepropionase-like amidohydrolase